MIRMTNDMVCPRCLTVHDGVTNIIGTNAPKDGDMSVCTMCTAFLVFEKNATSLREATQEELAVLPLSTLAELAIARVLLNARIAEGESQCKGRNDNIH